MIEIKYSYGYPEHSLEVVGHANYAEQGKDIVCSAVSTLVQTLALALREIPSATATIDSGEVVIGTVRRNILADHYFKFTLQGLEAIAEQYPGHVSIEKVG